MFNLLAGVLPSRRSEAHRGLPEARPRTQNVLAQGQIFFWPEPVAFRRVALETPEWTSRDSNHHRQSVSAGKTNAQLSHWIAYFLPFFLP